MPSLTLNRINAVIVPADVTLINTAITTITGKLPSGGTVALSPEERKSLLSVNVDNKVFVQDVITETAISGTTILPGYISLPNLRTDATLVDQLDALNASLTNLQQKVADLRRIAAHEAYTTATTIYKLYQSAAEAGIPGAQSAYATLAERFAAQGAGSPGNTNP